MNFKFQISNFKLDWRPGSFCLALILGIFLRLWHFSDWLYFKRDEARDAFEIWLAFSRGPEWLPLLGPDMTVEKGARFFVGPVYYYFQYLSALIFQSVHPAVLAFPDLFFSILTIPLLYLFLRKFFSRNWSFLLAALFAVDFLAVQYSRFAWNPNTLPFFNILFFYALLNIFDAKEKRPLLWSLVAGVAFAVATQLHVLAMLALPVILAAFLLLRIRSLKNHLNWKKIAVFVSAVAVLYSPVIAHEIVKNWRNFKVFFRLADTGQYYVSLSDSVLLAAGGVGRNWFLILTGYISGKDEIWTAILTWAVLIFPAIWLAYRAARNEKDETKKNFALLAILWFAGYFAVYIPVAMHFQTRFILPILVLPVIFAGLILNHLWNKRLKFFKMIAGVLLAAFFLGNLAGISLWFKEIRDAQSEKTVNPKRTLILKKQDGIVLWHLEQAAEYMKTNCDKKIVYLSTEREYETPMRYALMMKGIDGYPLVSHEAINRPGCAYYFEPSREGKALLPAISNDFNVLEQRSFGMLKMYRLEFKESADLSRYGEKYKEEKRTLFWRDLFLREVKKSK